MSTTKIYVAILTIILFLKPNASLEARSLKFQHCTSSFNSKYFSNLTLYALNDTVNAEIVLTRSVVSDLKSNVQIQIRLANSKNYQTLFGYTFDVCNMVVSFKDTLFKRLFKSLLEHSNLMQNCPILEGHYYVHSWHVESSLIPIYLYPGDYRLKGYGFIGKLKNKRDVLLEVTIDARIVQN